MLEKIDVFEGNNIQEDYLLRRITFNPNNVVFFNDMKLRLMQDINFESSIIAPKVLFSEEIFKNTSIYEDKLTIDFGEYTSFLSKLSSIFRENRELRQKVSLSIQNYLREYRNLLNEAELYWNRYNKLPSSKIEKLFEMICSVEVYSIFNLYLPLDHYHQVLNDLQIQDNAVSIDDFMISWEIPHRNQVRKEKLKLAKSLKTEGIINQEELNKLINDYLPYDSYDLWCFGDDRLTDERIIMSELKKKAKSYTLEEIDKELLSMESKRKRMLRKWNIAVNVAAEAANKKYDKNTVANVLENLTFLSIITSEEETRHMLEARHFVLLGRIMKKLKLDPGRTGIKDIESMASKLWG